MTLEEKKKRNSAFVDYIYKLCSKDKGLAANLRRADLKDQNSIVFSVLCGFGLDITKDAQFIPYCLITAAIARNKNYEDRTNELSFIKAMASVEKNGNSHQEKEDARFRRLLSCNDLKSLTLIFRHVMGFVQSRTTANINYSELLDDLCSFNYEESRQRVKRKWANQFYADATATEEL